MIDWDGAARALGAAQPPADADGDRYKHEDCIGGMDDGGIANFLVNLLLNNKYL